jgi:hypothetical protein
LDTQNASLRGATVTLMSGQGSKTLTTDANGRFFAPFLAPGEYSVKVELAGFTPVEQRKVEVRLGRRLELSFTLKVGDVHEVIEVRREAPVIDIASTTTGNNLLTDVLNRLPVARSFTATLYLVPGVSDGGNVGAANPSIGGASGLDNTYIVDGVNITDEGFGGVGAFSRVYGSLGSGVTTDFIRETQVKTGGFEAEYGMATGGVVNIVTNSGTNAFHGSAFGYMLPAAFESSYRQLQTLFGTVNRQDTQSSDIGVSAGGALIKDEVFLFGVFNPQFNRTTFTAPKGFPLARLGNVDRRQRAYAYAGKLTIQLSGSHSINISAFGDPSKRDNGPQSTQALAGSSTESFSALDFGGHSQNLKYEGVLSPNWLIEATVSHHQNHFTEVPSANTNSVTDATLAVPTVTGGLGFYQHTKSHRFDYQLESTNLFQAAGRHQLRYGADYESVEYDVAGAFTGPTFILPDGTPTVSGAALFVLPDPTYGKVYEVNPAFIGSTHQTPQKYFAAFLQDTWQIGRFTLRPGVRYEQQELSGNPPLCHANDSLPGAADGSGPTIPCSFNFNDNFAPRLGVTYDFSGAGKTKLYASFSRFYARIPNDLAARAMSSDAIVLLAFYSDPGLTRPLTGANYPFIISVAPQVIQPNAKLTYEQELAGGFELQAGPAINLGVRYVHRSIPRVLEDAIAVPIVADSLGITPPGLIYSLRNIAPGNPPIQSFPEIPFTVSEEGPIHKYDAIEVTANKTFAHNWALIASYRWSKLRGNFEGSYRNDNQQADPSNTSLFDFPINDPSYTAIGAPRFGYQGDIRYQGCALGCGELPNDRTHQLKIYGNYTFKSLNVALGINAGSGRVLTGLFANPVYRIAGEIPDNPRGSGILTVTDGFRKRTPFEFTVDGRVDYTFKMAHDRRVILSADAFNLLNNQNPTWYDVYHDRGFGVPNPNFGEALVPGTSLLTAYRTPRQIRIGARFEW